MAGKTEITRSTISSSYSVSDCVVCRRLFHHNVRRLSRSVSIPPGYVLKYMMLGQNWSSGDEQFYAAINVDTLLIHGRHDRLISLADTRLMQQVCVEFHF